MFKKFISIILALAMIPVAFPVLASSTIKTETTTINLEDSAYVRKGGEKADTPLGGSGMLVMDGRTSDNRVSFMKFDLTSVKDKLSNVDSMTLSFTVWGGNSSIAADSYITISILPSTHENWDSSTLTYNSANSDGLLTGGTSVYQSLDNSLANGTYTTGDIKSAIISHLESDTDDNIVCFRLDALGSGVIALRPNIYNTLTITTTVNLQNIVDSAAQELTFDDLSNELQTSVTQNLTLPATVGDGVSVEWSSSSDGIIDSSGIVTRPEYDTGDVSVTLTAVLTKEAATAQKTFNITVLKISRAELQSVVDNVAALLTLPTEPVSKNLTLPTVGSDRTTISWASSDETVIDSAGNVTRPGIDEGNKTVTLTATISKGSVSAQKTFTVTVLKSNRPPESMLLSTEIYPDIQTMVNGASNDVSTAYDGNQLIIDRGTRIAFMKFDFSSYEDICKTLDSVAFHFGTGGDCEPELNENITLCVLPDSMEEYVTNDLTWNIANTHGMTTYVGDSVYTLSDLKNAQKYTTASFLEDVQKNFTENTSNKTFAIKLVETTGNGYTIYNSSLGSYMYKPRLIVGYSIPDYQKDARLLKLPSVIVDDISLPSSGIFGSPITWESDNESVIASDGTATVGIADEDYSKEDSTAVLKATAYEDNLFETKEFTVRVRRTGIVDAIADTYVTSDGNYNDDDEIVLNSESGNVGLLSFDLTNDYAYALAGRKIVLKLYASADADDVLTLKPVTDASLKSADINELDFAAASDYASYIGDELTATQDANGHFIFDVTEYIWSQSDKKALFVLECKDGKVDLLSSSNLCSEPKLVISPLGYTDEFGAEVAKSDLDFSDISSDEPSLVRKDLTLPTSGRYGSSITWSVVPQDAVNTSSGELVRGSTDTEVTLTATITAGSQTVTKDFTFTMVRAETNEEYARYLLDTLALPASILTTDIELPGEVMPDGAVITWQSSEDYEAKVDGFNLRLTRPQSNHLPVTLTATINYNSVTLSKDFPITLLRAQNKNQLSYKLVKSGDSTAQYGVDDSIDTLWQVVAAETVYDMGSTQLLSGFSVVPKNSVSAHEVYMSQDNLIWEKVYTGTSLDANKVNSFVPDITAFGRYIKFVFPQGSEIAYIGAYSVVSSHEDEVFSGVTVPARTQSGFSLSGLTASGSSITWTSSSAVISISGTTASVRPASSDTLVTLTARIADGTQKTFVVLVPGSGSGGAPVGGSSSSQVSSSYPSAPSAGGGTTAPVIDSYFTDLADCTWAVIYINDLYSRGAINGVGGTSFAPNANLKREESAKIIAASLGITSANSQSTFTDVQNGEWYTDYIMAMHSAGIINGIGDGSFGIGINVTRQDAFCMVAGALKYLGVSTEDIKDMPFNDSAHIADYAKDAASMLYTLGIVNGDTNGNLNPTQMITRAEFSKVMYYAIKLLG